MKMKEALKGGIEAFTGPLIEMKQAQADLANERKQPQTEDKPIDLRDERGASDVESLGKMTCATGAVLAAAGVAMEYIGPESIDGWTIAVGAGGIAVGSVIYGMEKVLNR